MIHNADCREAMRGMDAESIDAIVTDPPYGLEFMGKGWDHGVPGVEFWTEAYRVAKPGAHLLAFGGTRTFHRLTCAIEDAGFEVRDCIMWVYGSGFPKSHNLRGEWSGWGTALKPAWEPIIVARKPLAGTVADNVMKHGTGAINVEACRVGSDTVGWGGGAAGGNTWNGSNCGLSKNGNARSVAGRWPANLIHDGSGEVLELFPEQAARFFYCAKASKQDRDEGVAGVAGGMSGRRNGSMGSVTMRKNVHPTVKPTALMRYLCRLVTPPGGTVLDPFMGSGSTGKAAALEGFEFVGCELDPEYCRIAEARIAAALNLFTPQEAAR